MKNLRLTLLAAKIELQWWFIKKQREKGNKLMDSGCNLSSPKMLSLNRRYSKHCTIAIKAQGEYERAMGITKTLQKAEVLARDSEIVMPVMMGR